MKCQITETQPFEMSNNRKKISFHKKIFLCYLDLMNLWTFDLSVLYEYKEGYKKGNCVWY